MKHSVVSFLCLTALMALSARAAWFYDSSAKTIADGEWTFHVLVSSKSVTNHVNRLYAAAWAAVADADSLVDGALTQTSTWTSGNTQWIVPWTLPETSTVIVLE